MTLKKNSNFKIKTTQPIFIDNAIYINDILTKYKEDELSKLMTISKKITEETMELIKIFEKKDTAKSPAIAAFSGTVFKELELCKYNAENIEFIKNNLYIFSAKYGILRSSDEICKYRLDAKTPIKIDNQTLYTYWQDSITKYLEKKRQTIINLASDEYSKLLSKNIADKIVNIKFKVKKDGKLKTVGYYSKVARGIMVNEIIIKNIEIPEIIKKITPFGFSYSKLHSTEMNWIFVRND